MSEEVENEISAAFARASTEQAQEVVEFFKEYLHSKLLRKEDYPHVLRSTQYLISLIEKRKEEERAAKEREKEERKREKQKAVYSPRKRRWRDCLEKEKEKERNLIETLRGQSPFSVPEWEWRGGTGRRNRRGTCEQQFDCFWDD